MLFPAESVARRRAEIARECDAGAISQLEAGEQFIAADPDFGGGYLMLGNAQADAGDLARAESSYWKALDRMPCHYSAYMALSETRRKRNPDDPLAERLMVLGIWKLGFSREAPDEVAEYFRKRMKELDFDFKDPTTYEALAMSLEMSGQGAVELRGRLLPYELLNDLHRHSAEGLDEDLVREMVEHAELLIPLWRAALREWAFHPTVLWPDALGTTIALLGETAGPEMIDDLLELACFGERTVYLHANWALWRLGERFPAEALATFRSVMAEAPLPVRCVMAKQIDLLPETPGMETALSELLEGFAGLADHEEAPHLLAVVMEALRGLEREDDAERIFTEYGGFLPDAARKRVREALDGEEFVSDLVNEALDELTIEEICTDRVLMEDEDEPEEDEFEDDFEEEQIAPVAAPLRPGRNEPCWCGSGKKYKKCHLAEDEQEERSHGARGTQVRATEPLHARLHRDLLERSREWHSGADLAEAFQLYFGERPTGAELDADTQACFYEWYLHDFRSASTGRTLVDEYLRRRAGRLDAAEREVLEAFRQARFGLWEVQRVEKDKGIELKDLFVGDRVFVHDVSSSRSMVRWDCVLSRIYQFEGRWYFGGNSFGVPRALLPRIMEQMESESREADQTAASFVRANSHRWHRLIAELSEQQFADLRLVNAEGDELEFSSAAYRVENEAALIAALESAAAFEAGENDPPGVRSFAWLEEAAEGPRRSYGNIEIRGGKLRLECNSRARLATGRKLVEKHGGSWIRHLGDSFESQDALKRKAREGKPRPKTNRGSALPPEVEREVLLKFKAEHYERWIDQPLPALEGRTPRQASRSPAGRRALEDLLRTMENNEERAGREGGAAFDFSVVRKRLGM